jgi:hypothetical protein
MPGETSEAEALARGDSAARVPSAPNEGPHAGGLRDETETDAQVFDAEADADTHADAGVLAADAGSTRRLREIDPVDAIFEAGLPAGSLIRQGDRLKAYRPLPPDRRREALEAGIAAFSRGDFFEAHELLEPAWMGTSDIAERELYQGLIKLAAGYVHCVRGNPIGMSRNLEGARQHLSTSAELDPGAARSAGIDLMDLLMEVEVRLKSVHVAVGHLNTNPTIMLELAEAAPRIR